MFSVLRFSSHNQPGQLFHHKKKNLNEYEQEICGKSYFWAPSFLSGHVWFQETEIFSSI